MSLDANLFTLILSPSKDDPLATDLVDPDGVVHYIKRRAPTSASYSFSMFDPNSGSPLATVSSPNPTSKQKTIELFNPSVVVPFAHTGSISFKWSFSWEEHSFEWKRDACYLIRKPDPPVIVCTCDPPQKAKRSALQILDYNLQRFDFEDRKGLEIAIIAGLLSFYDQSDEYKRRAQEGKTGSTKPNVPSPFPGTTPDISPNVAKKEAELPSEPNEVIITEDGEVGEYVQHCVNLLKDDSLLYIVLHANSASAVPKCVSVAEATKRMVYKMGSDDEDELHQYVSYDTDQPPSKGKGRTRPRINLDVPDKPEARSPIAEYRPPQSLTIHLSKIAMPELQPKPSVRASPTLPAKQRAASQSPPRTAPPPSGRPSSQPRQDKGKQREYDPPPVPPPQPSRSEKSKGRDQPQRRPMVSPVPPQQLQHPMPPPVPQSNRPQSYQAPQPPPPMGRPPVQASPGSRNIPAPRPQSFYGPYLPPPMPPSMPSPAGQAAGGLGPNGLLSPGGQSPGRSPSPGQNGAPLGFIDRLFKSH